MYTRLDPDSYTFFTNWTQSLHSRGVGERDQSEQPLKSARTAHVANLKARHTHTLVQNIRAAGAHLNGRRKKNIMLCSHRTMYIHIAFHHHYSLEQCQVPSVLYNRLQPLLSLEFFVSFWGEPNFTLVRPKTDQFCFSSSCRLFAFISINTTKFNCVLTNSFGGGFAVVSFFSVFVCLRR